MAFEPSSNITEQIAQYLTWEVITGRLSDRARIQELKLAKELGVSRGSVREALLLLQGRQLVDIVPRRGASVRPLTRTDIGPVVGLFADLFERALVGINPYPRGIAVPHLQALCDAATAGKTEETIRARDDMFRALVALNEEPYLQAALQPLVTASSRVGVMASAHADYDNRDAFRCCKGLHEALLIGDHTRVRELLHASLKRESVLATTAPPLARVSTA